MTGQEDLDLETAKKLSSQQHVDEPKLRGRPPVNRDRAAVEAASEDKPARRRKPPQSGDRYFHIPQSLLDDIASRGMSINWKRLSTYGMEENASYFMDIEDAGWTPLSIKKYPGFRTLMPATWERDTVERGGQRLYIRPMEFTEEAEREGYEAAREQVEAQHEKITGSNTGEFKRGGDPRIEPVIRKGRPERFKKADWDIQRAVDE